MPVQLLGVELINLPQAERIRTDMQRALDDFDIGHWTIVFRVASDTELKSDGVEFTEEGYPEYGLEERDPERAIATYFVPKQELEFLGCD